MQKIINYIKESAWAKIFFIFAFLSFLLRTIFFIWQKKDIVFSPILILKTYALGLFFDFVTLGYIALIPLLYYTFISPKVFTKNSHKILVKIAYFLFLYVIIFSFISEITFWDEFQARFNFIAVDYLIYTTEVIANIIESYPIVSLLSLVLAVSAAIFCISEKKVLIIKNENSKTRLRNFAILSLFLITTFFGINSSKLAKISDNNYVNEIATNGIYQLFSAYRNNELDYDKLYATLDDKIALNNLRLAVMSQEPNSKFLSTNDISRFVPQARAGLEKRHNVMLVVVESLSADFMTTFGNKDNITPNLDKLAKQSLFFTNMKATGARTVRGLEAISLGIPPTPGNSIVRRFNNENLFNISSPLKDRGYEAKFLYGGDGYFDNMNYFFGNNGFEIVDRDKFLEEEVSFSNAWGVADEDLFDKAIKEADKSFANRKPFLNLIMTTSNHRPFTYPDGKIDIKSKTNRNGAVKYSDYAIGQLIAKAKKKSWFDNTIFVIVADHCAGSAGNSDVPLWRYQIPAIFYAPKIIKPKVFTKTVSQIDVAPTLMGLLNLNYKSKFFGVDVINNERSLDKHAFVSTYSDVGYFRKNKFYLLKPKKAIKVFDVEIKKYGWQGSVEKASESYEPEELNKAISYYQIASYLFKNDKLKNFDQKK